MLSSCRCWRRPVSSLPPGRPSPQPASVAGTDATVTFAIEVDGELTARAGGNVGVVVEYVGLLMAFSSTIYL